MVSWKKPDKKKMVRKEVKTKKSKASAKKEVSSKSKSKLTRSKTALSSHKGSAKSSKKKLTRQNTAPSKKGKNSKKLESPKKKSSKKEEKTSKKAKSKTDEASAKKSKQIAEKDEPKAKTSATKTKTPEKKASPHAKILESWNANFETRKAGEDGSLSMWYWNEVRSYLGLEDLIQTRCIAKQFRDISQIPVEIIPEMVTYDSQYAMEDFEDSDEPERWVMPSELLPQIHIRTLTVQNKFYYPVLIASLETIVHLKLDSVEEDTFICPRMPNLKTLEMQNCTMNIEIAILRSVCPFIETLIIDPDNLFEDDAPTRNFEAFEFPNLTSLHTSLSLVVDFAKIPQLRSIHVAGEASFRNQFLNKIEEIEWSERNCTNWSSEFCTHLKNIDLNIRLDDTHFCLPIVLDCLHKSGILLRLKISYDITELWVRMDPEGLYVIDCDLEDENEDDPEVHAAFTKFLRELVGCHPNPNMTISFNQQKLGGQRAFTQRIVLNWLESTGMLQSTIMFTKRKQLIDDELEDISYE